MHDNFTLLTIPKLFFPSHIYQGSKSLNFLRLMEGEILMVTSHSVLSEYKVKISANLKMESVRLFLVNQEPSNTMADEFIALIKEKKYKYVVGFGGGAVMDIAKIAKIHLDNVHLCLIPTTAGSGSEVSRYSLFINEHSEKTPTVSSALLPDTVLYDPSLLISLSKEITAYTTIDAYSHALEGLTSRMANPISDLFANKALLLILENMISAIKNPKDLGFRENLQIAGFLAGLVQSSASVGLIHGMADFFGPRFGVEHGKIIGVFLLPVMLLNIKKNNEYYKKTNEIGDILQISKQLHHNSGLNDFSKEIMGQWTIELSDLSQFIKKDPAVRTHQYMPTNSDLEELLQDTGIKYAN